MTADERSVRHGRRGGLTSSANMTPAERTERARKAVAARWAAENARRAELGLAPTKRTEQILSATELEPWLEEVDRQFPDQRWENKEQRRRQALLLARQAAADILDGVFKRDTPNA